MDGAGESPILIPGGAELRPRGNANPSSLRGSVILVAAMFAWLIIVFILAAIAAPNDPNRSAPAEVGLGVVVTPASGWYSAADEWDVGPNALSLQKAGSFVAFAAEEFTGTNQELLDEQLGVLRQDFESFRTLSASPTMIAGDVSGLVMLFNGVSNSGRLEGEVVAAVSGGVGVIMLALAPQGQLSRVQSDLDSMLRGLQVPR